MSTFHIDKPDTFLKKIVAETFPSYTGRKFKLSTDIPSRLDSYWSGGSKDSFAFFCLATGKSAGVRTNHPFFEAGQPSDLDELPNGLILVQHTCFRGRDLGITVYANQADLAQMLPESTELTEDERIVLVYTRSLKSSYNGIKNHRFHSARGEIGITAERWEAAKASLIGIKCLNKAGAITVKGRNAIEDIPVGYSGRERLKLLKDG
jgi:hypothetical protein